MKHLDPTDRSAIDEAKAIRRLPKPPIPRKGGRVLTKCFDDYIPVKYKRVKKEPKQPKRKKPKLQQGTLFGGA